MVLSVVRRTESGKTIEGDAIERSELPDWEDERYPYLRLIDPWADTIFNELQTTHALVPELEKFAIERPSNSLDRVLALARRCGTHEYVWFVGD